MLHRLQLPADADIGSLEGRLVEGVLEVLVHKAAPTAIAVSEAAAPVATEEMYEVQRGVAGLKATDLSVKVEGGRLVIVGHNANTHKRYNWSLQVPEDADIEAAAAFCADGLLTVQLPQLAAVELPVLEVMPEQKEEKGEKEGTEQLMRLHVPGYGADNVKLTARKGYLTVRLQREGKAVVERLVALPEEVRDVQGVMAVCQHGVLTIFAKSSSMWPADGVPIVLATQQPPPQQLLPQRAGVGSDATEQEQQEEQWEQEQEEEERQEQEEEQQQQKEQDEE